MRYLLILLTLAVAMPASASVFTTKYYQLKGPVKKASFTKDINPYKVLVFNPDGKLTTYQRTHRRRGTTIRNHVYVAGVLKHITLKHDGKPPRQLNYRVINAKKHVLDLGPEAKRYRYRIFHLNKQGRLERIDTVLTMKDEKKPISRRFFEYSGDGNLKRVHVESRAKSGEYKTRFEKILQYNKNVLVGGKLKVIMDDSTQLVSEVKYKTDHYGNWTSRSGTFSIIKQGESGERNRLKSPIQEERFIEYYK